MQPFESSTPWPTNSGGPFRYYFKDASAAESELGDQAISTGLSGESANWIFEQDATADPGSPLAILYRMILRGALPYSIPVFVTESGKTERKKAYFLAAFGQEQSTQDANRRLSLFHLMTYAGRDNHGHPVLIVLPKPVFGNLSISPFLHKTGSGGVDAHLVLDKGYATRHVGGFWPLSPEELSELTGGMNPHGVNPLLSTATLDADPDLRIVVCGSFFAQYWGVDDFLNCFIEMPLGCRGETHSVVVPLELFLAFLQEVREEFPHFELINNRHITPHEIESEFAALREVFEPDKIRSRNLFNPNRPMMATFQAVITDLGRAINQRTTFLDSEQTRSMATNFVRHFFSREHNLIQDALRTTSEEELLQIFEKLRATEYGAILLPCGSVELFNRQLAVEAGRHQPPLRFDFAPEAVKSERYVAWIARIANKLAHHSSAARRTLPSGDIRSVIAEMKARLERDCINHAPANEAETVRIAVTDIVELIFGRILSLVNRIERKVAQIAEMDNSQPKLAQSSWGRYRDSALNSFRDEGAPFQSEWRRELVLRYIHSDLRLLSSLPFFSQIGGPEAIHNLTRIALEAIDERQ